MVNYVKLLIAIASMLMLSSLALAVPESSQLGPYTISFDMNTNLQHELMVMEPIQTPAVEIFGVPSATNYGMQIFTDNSTNAALTIREFASPIDSTSGPYKQMLLLQAALSYFNVTNVADRIIDGKAGFLLTSEPVPENTAVPADMRLYRASYWMDSKECDCGPVSAGTIRVDITSSYPMDVTESMLSSLRVMKGAATAMPPASGSMDMPPATN
jgi:hypothetical protein